MTGRTGRRGWQESKGRREIRWKEAFVPEGCLLLSSECRPFLVAVRHSKFIRCHVVSSAGLRAKNIYPSICLPVQIAVAFCPLVFDRTYTLSYFLMSCNRPIPYRQPSFRPLADQVQLLILVSFLLPAPRSRS